MEKKIIIFCCLILAWAFYKYPVFDNANISYLIIFSCAVIITFAVAKTISPTEKENYESAEKERTKLENFDGIFNYKKNGFYVTQNKITEFIKWDDILEVNSFSIPYLSEETHSGFEIITENKNYEFNDKQSPGIEKLGNQLFDNLPNWKFDSPTLKINNYGLKKTNLYKKENCFSICKM